MNSENDTKDEPAQPKAVPPLQRVAALPLDLMKCIVFFTRIPVPLQLGHDIRMNSTSQAFPLVGLLIGLSGVLAMFVSQTIGLSSLPGAVLGVAIMILLTGALHEDGLADTADGFGGGTTIQRKLEIMKDSSIGTYGMLALLMSQLLRVSLLASLINAGMAYAVAGLLSAAMISRAASMNVWYFLPNARESGLSQSVGQPDLFALIIAWGTCAVLLLIYPVWIFGIDGLVASLLACFAFTILFQWLCDRQIRGQTGDTIGAAQQLAELVFLCGLLISINNS